MFTETDLTFFDISTANTYTGRTKGRHAKTGLLASSCSTASLLGKAWDTTPTCEHGRERQCLATDTAPGVLGTALPVAAHDAIAVAVVVAIPASIITTVMPLGTPG